MYVIVMGCINTAKLTYLGKCVTKANRCVCARHIEEVLSFSAVYSYFVSFSFVGHIIKRGLFLAMSDVQVL